MNPNLQAESERLDNCRYLLDVDDNRIEVNEPTLLKRDYPVRDRLTFQLLNPERASRLVFDNPAKLTAEQILNKLQAREPVSDTSYVRFFFPYGDEQGDFIDAQRGQLISFETESGDWSVAQGVVEDGFLSFVVSCYNRYVIETLFSMYFRCVNIQSYAPAGLTYVYADIRNVAGIENVVKVFPIQKTAAVPQINRFFGEPTTVGVAGPVRLKWQISGADKGQLTPGEIDIFSLPAPGTDVALSRNMAYRLSITGSGSETDAWVNVYVQPPEIERLDYDPAPGLASWHSRYDNRLRLGLGNEWSAVEQSGSLPLALPVKPQLALRADGRLYREAVGLNLQGLTLEQPQRFRSRIRVYTGYVQSRWTWVTQDAATVSFEITEDGLFWHAASADASGTFEYVSDAPLPAARLVCTKSDGSAYPILRLEGEAAQWIV